MTYETLLEQWNKDSKNDRESLEGVLENFRVLFAYNSNKIEGSKITLHQTRELFDNGKIIGYTGDLREIFETQNQKICLDLIADMILAEEPISVELIKKIHEILLHGCYDEKRWQAGERPGQFKKKYYGVGEEAGVLPEDVESEMGFLCEQVSSIAEDSSVEDILTAAAYLHCNFEYIHPFADGNGRTGRMLLNYFLLLHDLPPVIIFDEDKEAYYMALTVFDKAEKLDGFVQFLKDETVKTWYRKKRSITGITSTVLCL